MLSSSRNVVYPVNEDITEFDMGTDVSEYDYDGRSVFRGNLDPEYSTTTTQVYWLYDDYKRVGLAEHYDGSDENYTCYWFRDNVYATLLQEEGWEVSEKTLWNTMSDTAYEDVMRSGWSAIPDIKARTTLSIVVPSDLHRGYTPANTLCIRCLSARHQVGCTLAKKVPTFDVFSTVFVDQDGVIYIPPSDTRAYATLRRTAGFLVADGASTTVSDAVGVGAGAGAGAGASSVSSSSASASSSAKTDLAPPATGVGASSASS